MIRYLERRLAHLFFFLLIGGIFLGGCKNGEPDPSSLFKTNQLPIANAGPDQSVPSGATVTLDGSGSSDPNGKTFHYQWKITATPPGSNAALDTPGSVTTTFVADIDGVYRIQLLVIEDVDPTLPVGAPVADTGLTSEPDEVMVIAGPPGPFPDSGNKLLLDGSHFALSTTTLDIGDPTDGSQLNEMTTEGWIYVGSLPAQGEALVMGKQNFFEIVLNSASALLFRITPQDKQAPIFQLGPASISVGQWHHVAAIVSGTSKHHAYFAVDGVTVAAADFNGLFNNNSSRFTIGGANGRAFLVGMADEVRVTQDVRYPESGFDPPKQILIPDSPFVSGARFAVHGLWHFDEPAGAKFFTDFSFRQNNLFLVGNTGFQPFGRLQTPRRFHTAAYLNDESTLNNQSLWIAGGIDDANRAVTDTEIIGTDDQTNASASLNPPPIKGEQLGVGNGTTTTFSLQTVFKPVLPQSVTITAGNVQATDDGKGNLSGLGIKAGSTIHYDTGQIQIIFNDPPYVLHVRNESLGTGNGTTTHFHATLSSTPIQQKSLEIFAGNVVVDDDGSGNLTGVGVQPGGTIDYNSGVVDVTFRTAPAQGVSITASYDYNNKVVIPTNNMPILIDYSFDRGGGLFDHTATRLDNGTVLAAGGDNKDRKLVGLSTLFNPTPPSGQPKISLVGPMITPRRFHTAARLADGRVMLVGGENDSSGSPRTLATTEFFNPVSLKFESGPSQNLIQARKLHRMIALNCGGNPQDDRLLVVGGYDDQNRPMRTAEVYSGSSNGSFSLTGSMSVERIRHAVVCLKDGTVLVTGGIDLTGHVLNSAEVYDPGHGVFTLLQAGMNTPRAEHTATLLPNGTVLIAGGFDQSGAGLASAEIYDPKQKLFIPVTSPMGIGRFGHLALPWHSAAVGKDGVLLIGGGDAGGTPTALLEIYYP